MSGKYNFEKKYKIGDIITNNVGYTYIILNYKVSSNMNDPTKRKRRFLWYYVCCKKCGTCFWVKSQLIDKKKCFCEEGWKGHVFVGINDIPTTDPWMIKYFPKGIEEASKYQKTSNQEVIMECPYCGERKKYRIDYLYKNHGLPCTCSDNITYPEKFMLSLLKQIGIEFLYQAGKNIFSWISGRHKYDFYIPELSCIIETHGLQHYQGIKSWGKLDDTQDKDNKKKAWALEHGIKHYIVIDCRKSEHNWIKISIINSGLLNLLNITEEQIDWKQCERECSTNLNKKICDYYMKTCEERMVMAEKFKVCQSTIVKALKKGNLLGWCVYEPKNLQVFPVSVSNENNTIYFASKTQLAKKAREVFGFPITDLTYRRYADTGIPFNGFYINREKSPKIKFQLLYGDKAVKWFEEHPEFAA